MTPGNAGASLLYSAVLRKDPKLQMPPKDSDRLTQEQVWQIRDWIDAGAPWPDAEAERRYVHDDLAEARTASGVIVPTSGGLSDDWTNRRYQEDDLWAFRPLSQAEPPGTGAEHPVDAFIERKLADAGLAAAKRADKRMLIRRASFDLTGLPPTPEQVEAFLRDDSAAAWRKVVDRLLESPQYGEQWGRHWLDVVRYADTSGYSNDWERSNAWRYRDYVVRSLNSDKPYDRFVLEQLAGDILDPDSPEMRVATGYLRTGPWEHTGMMQKVASRQLYLDDITNSVGESFLSLPLRCAKCHDHKFDPIPTRDYYRIYAVFETTQLAELPVEFIESENRNYFEQERARLQRLLAAAESDVAKIEAKEERAARAWSAERGIEYQPREKLKDRPEGEKPPRHIGLTIDDLGYFKVRRNDAKIWGRRLERYQPMAHSVYEGPVKHENSERLRMPEPGKMRGLPPESHILSGGSVYSKGDRVTPGVLSAVPVSYDPAPSRKRHDVPSTMTGPAPGAGALDRQPGESPLHPFHRQSHLAIPFRAGLGRERQQPRQDGQEAHAPRTARLAGAEIRPRRLVTETDAPPADDIGSVPARRPADRPRRGCPARPEQRPAQLLQAAAADRRGASRFHAGRIRRAQSGGGRIAGVPRGQRGVSSPAAHESSDHRTGLPTLADAGAAQPARALHVPHADADRSAVRGVQPAQLRPVL